MIARRVRSNAPDEGISAEPSSPSVWSDPANEPRKVRPDDLTHAERDGHGHFASSLKEQDKRAAARARWNWHVQRGADLAKVIAHRIAPETAIPETDDAEVLILCMARHLRAQNGDDDFLTPLLEWCDRMAPWVHQGETDILTPIVRATAPNNRDLTAKTLGNVLRVTWDERCRLGLRTIRPCGMTDEQFKQLGRERKRIIDRQGSAQRRREAGQKRWADHAWQSRLKPWSLIGFGRRTWEKAARERRLADLVARARVVAPDWLVGLVRELDAGFEFSDCAFSSRIPEGVLTGDESAQNDPIVRRQARRSPVKKYRKPSSPMAVSRNAKSAATPVDLAAPRREDTAPFDTLTPLRNSDQQSQITEKPDGSQVAA